MCTFYLVKEYKAIFSGKKKSHPTTGCHFSFKAHVGFEGTNILGSDKT